MAAETKFGMTPTWLNEDEPVKCPADRCGRAIAPGESCFRDERGILYCDNCGKVMRYERKKEAERLAHRLGAGAHKG